MRRLGRVIAILAATLSITLAGCGDAASPSPATTTSPSPSAAATAAPTGTPAGTATSAPPGSPGTTVTVDPSLLAVLPATVGGLAVTENADGESSAMGDPEVGKVASAVVAALAVDAPTGQFVFAVVVRLRPGALDDAGFRDWRDSFDQGACSQAGSVSGNAQTEINGRTVYIGTCTGGVRTYHVWIPDQELLVSASSVGDLRLGEKLMDGLRL